MQVIHGLRSAAVAALLLAVQASPSHAQTSTAGTVEFASGDASIRAPSGQARPAQRGAVLNTGDSIETGQGRMQLRMVDGAFISLQPQSLLRLDAYTTAGANAGEERGFLGLLRGGLRTVTGSIGRVNRNGYRLSTPTATIGIRGTEFAVTADAGTRVNVTDGTVALCNTGGCLNVGSGQSGFTPDATTQPVLAFAPARLPPTASTALPAFVVSEQRTDGGRSGSIAAAEPAPVVGVPVIPVVPVVPVAPPAPIPLANGPGPFPLVLNNTGGGQSAGVIGGTFTFNAQGAMTQYADCCQAIGVSAGVVPDFGADGIIAWGRWTGGNSTFPSSPGAVANLQYIAALNANVSSIPIVRGFTSFASTAPTAVSAGVVVQVGTPNSVTGSMNVNFTGGAGGTMTYLLNVPLASQTFTINGTAAQFSTTAFLGSASTITSTGAGCASGCTGNIPFANAFGGVITGVGATRAGGVYGFDSGLGKVSGAVVFR